MGKFIFSNCTMFIHIFGKISTGNEKELFNQKNVLIYADD